MRDIQEAAALRIVEGDRDVVILAADTSIGKTEAAMVPILSLASRQVR
ncbi:MAG: DEAD/DEAH box helicase [Myxococcales bacterium]|nr:DEAD/DEAH box helicase [Myxococcales bacterium]